jgi:hypothetical protein
MLLRPAPCNLTLQGVASVLTGPLEAPRLDAETARFYVPELDSLRFLGFLAVFICHLFDEMGGSLVMTNTGTFAVDLFFTLSAYLITGLLMREKERFARVDVKSFYVRRVLRIWPLYLGFLSAVFHRFEISSSTTGHGYLFDYLHGVSLQLCPRAVAEDRPRLGHRPIVECVSLRTVLSKLAACCPISHTAWGGNHGCPDSVVLDSCSRGVNTRRILAPSDRVEHVIPARSDRMRPAAVIIPRRFNPTAAEWMIAGFCLFRSDTPAPRDFIFAFSLAAIGCGAFLLATIGSGSWMCNSRLIYLGRISHGLYVYHGVMILATLAIFASCPGWVKWLICPPLSLGATIAVSAVSYRWFETPFLRLKARFQYIRSASPAIG